jgi:hypothetical protein
VTRVKGITNNYLKAHITTVLIYRNKSTRWITNLPARNQSKKIVLNLSLQRVILKLLSMPLHSKRMLIYKIKIKIKKSIWKKMYPKLSKEFSTKIIILKANITFWIKLIKFIFIKILLRLNNKLKSRKNMQRKIKELLISWEIIRTIKRTV